MKCWGTFKKKFLRNSFYFSFRGRYEITTYTDGKMITFKRFVTAPYAVYDIIMLQVLLGQRLEFSLLK
jgi:hypothetical protein